MSKYQAYPEYKDSGVEWLGEIPSHWKTCRLKHLASIKNGQDYKAVQSEVGYPVMGSGGQFAFATEFMYDKPSVLLGRKGTIDKPLYINEPFWTVDTMYYTEMQPEIGAKYLYYLATIIQFARYSTNTALPSMTQEHLSNYIFAVPVEVSDRTQIANFLDHETAKIDTLIDKQQQLIRLLKEKRQAVISHAVTKGLNPDVPMKDSGVEWLGEVPEHWVVMKFNHCAQIRNGLVDPKGSKYRDMVLYAPNHIEKATGKVLYRETASEQGADSSKYLCYQGEVIYSKIRPALAKVAICTEELALCSADMYPISCINGLKNEWLYWFMLSDNFTKAVVLDSDRVAMPKVNRESLGDYRIPFPTENEQSDISSHIKMQAQKLDELEAKANHAIKLMQESRTALISAAVTGKIDVRNWQAPTSEYQTIEQTA